MRRTAFTLIELLVVVTIIVLLLAILLPAFGGAIGAAEVAKCQSNNRQFIVAHHNYTVDNGGYFVQGCPGADSSSFVMAGPGYDPIRNGAMYQYMPNFLAWQCPADPSNNARTYDILGSLRGEGYGGTGTNDAGTDRLSGVTNLARQLLCVEESDPRNFGYTAPPGEGPNSWNVGSFIFGVGRNSPSWVDAPGLFHNNGTADDMGFLDGHVERWAWSAKTIAFGIANKTLGVFGNNDASNPDLMKFRAVYRNMPATANVDYYP
jgi:prepilin-type N-terminal cleavage/methylation domain-containing protein